MLRSFATATVLQLLLLLPASSFGQTAKSNRTPVLVELFTSEGCSSCPPADALLAKLDREQPLEGVEIIILGEHVDYWDDLGWHDRFSSHQFTDRQNQYSERLSIDSVYTPQMIIDGTDQFVGNDGTHARRSILHAAQIPKISLALSHPATDGKKISASLSFSNLLKTNPPHGDIYAVLVDSIDTTQVRSGENGGRILQHAGVVRTLQRIGSLKDLGTRQLSFSLNAPANSALTNMRLVAFAQQSGQGAILGAISVPVTQQ